MNIGFPQYTKTFHSTMVSIKIDCGFIDWKSKGNALVKKTNSTSFCFRSLASFLGSNNETPFFHLFFSS